MDRFVVAIRKVGPAPLSPANDRGNPWIHEWIYNDGSVRRVVVGALRQTPQRRLSVLGALLRARHELLRPNR
jgi:hypothetical protein